MFGEKFKRIVAIMLILGMVATSNGFATLAAGVDNIVNSTEPLDQTGPKNYYEMMYQEEYYEQTTIVNNTLGEGENSDVVGSSQNTNQGSTYSDLNEYDDFDVENSNGQNAYEEEKEEDDTDKTSSTQNSDISTADEGKVNVENDNKENTDENQTNETNNDKEETKVSETNNEETTTTGTTNENKTADTESSEGTTETTTTEATTISEDEKNNTASKSNIVEEEAGDDKTGDDETATASDVEEINDATVSDAKEVVVSTVSEVDDEIATASEIEEIATKSSIASPSVLDLITDLKSTASTLKFATRSVATASNATKSVVRETIYIKATRSAIATTSVWKLERFLIDDNTHGSFVGHIPTEKEMNDKYLPKKVKVLLKDQLGNEKVVEINAKWNYQFVDHRIGQKIDENKVATMAYVPNELRSKGIKIDENTGTFAKDSVNVAKLEEDARFEAAVEAKKNEYREESVAASMEEESHRLEELDESVSEEVADDSALNINDNDSTDSSESDSKVESTVDETVAGFSLSDADAEPEYDDGSVTVDEDGNVYKANRSDVSVNNSVDYGTTDEVNEVVAVTTGTSSDVVENGTDAAIVDPFVVETVYELTDIEKVSARDKQDEPGLHGNIATQLINPNTADWGIGSELNVDDAMKELTNLLGDDIVLIPMDSEKPVIKTFGDGLFGAGAHSSHRADAGNTYGPTSNLSVEWSVSNDETMVNYANWSGYSAGGTQIVLTDNVTIKSEIDLNGRDLYLCLNGYTLTFGQTDSEADDEGHPGRLYNVGNVIITTCNSGANRITGWCDDSTDTAHYGRPYDRKILTKGVDKLKSTASSCIETVKASGVKYCGIHGTDTIEIDYIWSNYHNKIKYTSYDTDAAAFINSKGAYDLWLDNVNVHDLVGCQGGVLKAERAVFFTVLNSTFTHNKAFMGACFNVNYLLVDGGRNGQGSLKIQNNTFEKNSYAFLDYDDNNPYTFGRYTFEQTEYFPLKSTNEIDAKVSVTADTGAAASAGNKPTNAYQYQNLGYEATTYDYDTYKPNGLILIDNFSFGRNTGTAEISNNIIKDNMPYDLCSTFHLSLSNQLTDSGLEEKVKINFHDNDITNNAQYKPSLNSWDSAAGVVISVNPNSYYNHLGITYETAYRMDENSNPVEYQKEVYVNDERGTAGVLDFYNNNINGNYNSSANAGSVTIRNMKTANINYDSTRLTKGDDTKIVENNFTAGNGAAYEFFRNGKTRVYNTVFKNNNSIVSGGAVYISGEKDIEFINEGTKDNPTVTFTDNFSRSFGGAVYASDSEAIKFTNVDFKNNYLLSGARWTTTMGILDYYKNWFYQYENGALRRNYPNNADTTTSVNFDATVPTYADLNNIAVANESNYNAGTWAKGVYYAYVVEDDATYYIGSKDTDTGVAYSWTDYDDAWLYYPETRKAPARGLVEPYTFGDRDTSNVVYAKIGSREYSDFIFPEQKLASYDLANGAIGSEAINIGKGGAFSIQSAVKTKVTFEDCNFENNLSSYIGGGVYASTDAGTLTIMKSDDASERVLIKNNISGRAGGFMMAENTKVVLKGVNIEENRSEQGGAIFTFTDPDKKLKEGESKTTYPNKYEEEDTKLTITKTDFKKNEFLKDTDITPYEKYERPKEIYNSTSYDNTVAGKGVLTYDYHNYTDVNNEAKHSIVNLSVSDMKIAKTTDSEAKFNAGGAVYTYGSLVEFDTGAYLTENVNTLYSVAGSTVLTRQTSNHGLNTKEEEITFEGNTGQYVFGHFSIFKAKFQLYGGKIVNNNLEEKQVNNKTYKYIATESVIMAGRQVPIYTARDLSPYRKPEERVIVLGGNITIKGNKQGSAIYNLGLEEGKANRNYKFELSNTQTLHKNAEIYLTPLEPNKARYQVFGNSEETWAKELASRQAKGGATGYDEWVNHGLWTDEWIEGLGEGAVVQNVFKNDLADDENDGRVVYAALNEANNTYDSSGHAIPEQQYDFGQIYLEDPSKLITMKFDLMDLDASGNHRYESQFEQQYFTQGSKAKSPLPYNNNSEDSSIVKDLMKFSADSSIRLIDMIGWSGNTADQRFDVWDFEHYQVTKGDSTIGPRTADDKVVNIPGDNDTYNVQTLFAINAMTNHRHKVCGTPVGVPCNHPDGSNHDSEIYGDNGTSGTLLKIGRTHAVNLANRVGGNLSIEVATLAQLMYARKHPEYMYVLTNDIVIEESVWNRSIDGVINDTDNPIENLKLCLNGHNIYINTDRDLATFFGPNCYITNCQAHDVYIKYLIDPSSAVTGANPVPAHNHYSSDYVFKVAYGNNAVTPTNFNLLGNENGHIVIEGLYMPSANNNTLVNLSRNDKLNMKYVDFKDIGNDSTSLLSTSLLDVPCDAYIHDVTFNNIVQELKENVKKGTHNRGQGILHFDDSYEELEGVVVYSTAKKQEIKNITFKNITVKKQYSAIVAVSQRTSGSTFNIDKVSVTNSQVGGRGAFAFVEAPYYRGNVSITNSTFSELHPMNPSGYTGGALFFNEYSGKVDIINNHFENVGVSATDLSKISGLDGGAIYFGNVTRSTDTNPNNNPVTIKNNKFIKLIAGKGGAIYMLNTPKLTLENNEFKENFGETGSAVYEEYTLTGVRSGDTHAKDNVFTKNGLDSMTTRGTYYIRALSMAASTTGNPTPNIYFENFNATENKGANSVFYLDAIAADAVIDFKGNTVMKKNVGGPVIAMNQPSSGKNEGTIKFHGNTIIASNSTANSYAVTAANKNVSFKFEWSGIFNVLDNKNNANNDANIMMNDNIKTSVISDEKFIATLSKVYFSTQKDEPLIIWREDTIENIYDPAMYLEEHLLTDNLSAQNFIIYRTDINPDVVYIGLKTDVIYIKGYMTSTVSTLRQMVAKKGAVNVLMDNFTDPIPSVDTDMRYLPPEYTNGTYKFGGWVVRNHDGKYVKIENGKTRIDVTDDITLDALWTYYGHGHKPDGTPDDASNPTEWVLAFRESVLNIYNNRPYMLTEDIKLSYPILNPKNGFAICLNGHTITKYHGSNFVKINQASCSNTSLYIYNHDLSHGGINVAPSDRNTSENLITVEGDTTYKPVISMENVSIGSIKYNGNLEGILINAKNAKIDLKNVAVDGANTVTKAIFKTVDCEVDIEGDKTKSALDYNFYDSVNDVNHFAGLQGLMNFEGGKLKLSNLVFANNRMATGMGLLYLKNATEEYTIDNCEFTGNSNVSNDGGAGVYVSEVEKLKLTDCILNNNTAAYGAALYIDDYANSNGAIELSNVKLNGNSATQAGGTIYHINKTAGHKFTLSLTKGISLDGNTADSATLGGGAIAFDSMIDNETENDVLYLQLDTPTDPSAKNVLSNNKASAGNGGFMYAKDVDINVITSENASSDISGNYSKKQGGVFYLDRAKLNFGAVTTAGSYTDAVADTISEVSTVYNNISGAEGAFIYSKGTSKLATGKTSHKDSVIIKDINILTATSGSLNWNHSGNDGGLVAIGPYADLTIDGAVNMYAASNANKRNLYFFANGINDLRIHDVTGVVGTDVVRKAGSNFDEANSKLLVTTEYSDFVVLEGYDNTLVPYDNTFHMDAIYNTMVTEGGQTYRIYRGGTVDSTTVLIGNNQGIVKFDIGSGSIIKHWEYVPARNQYEDVEYNRDAFYQKVSLTVPYDQGIALEKIIDPAVTDMATKLRRDSSTYTGNFKNFGGWVTTIWNGTTWEIGDYDFGGTSQAYLPSGQGQIIVRAMWKDDAGNYEIANYDQLFFKNGGNDVNFVMTGDVRATRTELEALAPFNRASDMTLDLGKHTLILEQDVKGFIDEAKAHAITIKNGTIEWAKSTQKENPFIVAGDLTLGGDNDSDKVTIKNFNMNNVFVDVNKLIMKNNTITENKFITFKAREDGTEIAKNTWENNDANQSSYTKIGKPEYPFIYIATASATGTVKIHNNTWKNNSFIYSYIMTDLAQTKYDFTVEIKDNDMNIGNAATSEKSAALVLGGDYNAVIKTKHETGGSDTAMGKYVVSSNSIVCNTNMMSALIDAYDTTLEIEKQKFENMKFQQYLIKQESYSTKKVKLSLKDTTITGANIEDRNNAVLIMVRKKQVDSTTILNTFDNVTINNNKALFAFVALDPASTADTLDAAVTLPRIAFASKSIIKGTKHMNRKDATGDIYVPVFTDSADTRNMFEFKGLTIDSDIWFYRPVITDGELVVNGTWMGGVDASDESYGATGKNFHMYDKGRKVEYILYKDNYCLRVTKKNANENYKSVKFDLNRGDVNASDYVQITNLDKLTLDQYIKDGSFVDEPLEPKASNFTFGGWYVRATDSQGKLTDFNFVKYEFNENDAKYRLSEGTSLTLYAKWVTSSGTGKLINMTVYGNSFGRSADGTVDYGETTPFYVVYSIPMGSKISDTGVTKKAYNKDNTEITWAGPDFTRLGQTEGGWWTENGWNNGRKDEEWGIEWRKTEYQWLIDKDVSQSAYTPAASSTTNPSGSGNLYARWRGTGYDISYDLNDGGAAHTDGGTTNATMSMVGVATKAYFNEKIADNNPLPTPTRVGYTFAGWYSNNSFDENARVIANQTYYNWDTNKTFYAKWNANKYNVIYKIDSQYIDVSGNMKASVFTFDKTDDALTNINSSTGFRVSGHDFKWWEGKDLVTGKVATFSNQASKRFNFATLSGTDYELVAKFKPQTRTITFNANDTVGNNSAVLSVNSKIATYGVALGELPKPTRDGYQFAGWYVSAKRANAVGGADDQYLVNSNTKFDENDMILLQSGNEFVPYQTQYGVKVMRDITLYARWETNLYTIDTENGALPTDDPGSLPEGDDLHFDTAFDFADSYVDGDLRANIVFPAAQYKRQGYTYLGLYGKLGENPIHIGNTGTMRVTIGKTSPLYNFGATSIASGTNIVLRASWSQWKYNLTINSGLSAVKTKDPSATLVQGMDIVTKNGRKYTEKDTILSLIGGTEYSIPGWQFTGFKDNAGNEFKSYTDIVYGATFSSLKENGANITLTGQWRNNFYTIHYQKSTNAEIAALVTGADIEDQDIDVGMTAKLTNVKNWTYLGHTFKEWEDIETHATYSNAQNVINVRHNQNDRATLSAVWTQNNYNILFNENLKTGQALDAGSDITLMNKNNLGYDDKTDIGEPTVSMHGYTIKEYNTTKRGDGLKVTPSTVTLRNYVDGKFFSIVKDNAIQKLYVIWEANEYKVALDMNDTSGSTRAVPATTSMAFTYASKLGDKYVSILKGGANAPTRPGYTLNGWAKDKDGTVVINKSEKFEPTNLTGDTVATFYAIWKPEKYKLYINGNSIDGQAGNVGNETSRKNVVGINVEFDRAINSIASLPLSYLGGYTLLNYATASNPSAGYTPITEDTIYNFNVGDYTIFAQYAPNTYKVHYSTDSDAEVMGTMPDQTFVYGREAKLTKVDETETSTTFKKKGYTFKEWTYTNKEANPTNALTRQEAKDTFANEASVSRIRENNLNNLDDAAILTPVWTEHTYTIRFNPGTDSLLRVADRMAAGNPYTYTGIMPDTEVRYTQEVTIRNSFDIPGYEFVGWKNMHDGTIITPTSGTSVVLSKLTGEVPGPAGDKQIVELKAQWKPREYNITLVRNDANNNRGSTIATISVAGVEKAANDVIVVVATYDKPYPVELLAGGTTVAKRDGYSYVGWSKTQDVDYIDRDTKVITATDVYDTAGDGFVYALWKNLPITAKLYVYTRDLGGRRASWSATEYADDSTPKEHTVYYDLPYGKFTDTGYNLNPTELEKPVLEGTKFVRYFAPRAAAEATPDWSSLLSDTQVTGFDSIVDGVTDFNSYNIVETDASGKKFIRLFGFWGASQVDLHFVSTYSDVRGEMYRINEVRQVAKGAQIGNIPNNVRTGYTLDAYYSYATMSDSNPADPTTYNADGSVDHVGTAVKIERTTVYWDAAHPATVYAVWKPRTFTVRYDISPSYDRIPGDAANPASWDKNGPSGGYYKEVNYEFDSWVDGNTMPVPKRNGYKFLYWAPNGVSEPHYDPSTGFRMNIYGETTAENILTPVWEREKYVITYDMWGGDDHENLGGSVPKLSEEMTNADGIVYRAGYVGKVTASVTYNNALYAGFQNNGTNLPKPERDGYTFGGWYAGVSSRPMYAPGTTIGSNWSNNDVSGNGWSMPVTGTTRFVSANVIEAGQATTLNNVTFFAKWIPKPIKITYVFGDNARGTVTGAVRLTSQNRQYTRDNDYVVFNTLFSSGIDQGVISDGAISANGGKNPPVRLSGNFYSANAINNGYTGRELHAYPDTGNADITNVNYTIKEGYDFLGFNTESDGTGTWITNTTVDTFVTNPNALVPSLNVYAQFRPRDYGVQFVTNTVNDNPGDDAAGTPYYDIPTNGVTWTVNGVEVANSGYTMQATMDNTVFNDTNLPVPSPVPGYTFEGWWTRNGAKGGIMNTSNDDWGTQVTGKTFGLTFDTIANGYDFTTFAEDSQKKNVARNIKVYARWKRNTYQVVWDGNKDGGLGGETNPVVQSNVLFESLLYGMPYNINPSDGQYRAGFPSATRRGFTFKNWSFDSDYNVTHTGDGDIIQSTRFLPPDPSSNIQTIYAVWEANTYTLKLSYNPTQTAPPAISSAYTNANDHVNDMYDFTVPGDQFEYTIKFGDPLVNAGIPISGPELAVNSQSVSGTLHGFEFKNWAFDTKNDIKFNNPGSAPTETLKEAMLPKTDSRDITLYACWGEKEYQLDVVNPYTGAVQNFPGLKFNTAESLTLNQSVITIAGSEFKGLDAIKDKTVNPHYNVVNNRIMVTRLTDNTKIATLYAILGLADYKISYRARLEDDTTSKVANFGDNFPTWYNYKGAAENDITNITTKPSWSRLKFLYWEMDPWRGTTATASSIYIREGLVGDVVLTAVFEGRTVEVIFHKNDGTDTTVTRYIKDSGQLIIPSLPWTHKDNANQVISYWSTGKDGGSQYTSYQTNGMIQLDISTTELITMDLYAIWGSNSSSNGSSSGGRSGGSSGRSGGSSGGSRSGGGGSGGGAAAAIAGGTTPISGASPISGEVSLDGLTAINGVTANAAANGINGMGSLAAASTLIANDISNIAALLKANANVASGDWKYDPVANSWTYELKGNSANTSGGTGKAQSGWYLINNGTSGTVVNSTYDANGQIQNGMTISGNKAWYKFDASGNMVTGLQIEDTGIYYLNSNPQDANYGALAMGWVNILGHDYYFDNTGRLLTNGVTPDGWVVDINGMRGGFVGGLFDVNISSMAEPLPVNQIPIFTAYYYTQFAANQAQLTGNVSF